jgi:type II secretory pathway pseudopilin PulG
MSVRRRSFGFTLIEIIFTLTLVVVLAALSLWTLRPANSKAPSRGLATALSEELSAARQLAISSGHPVALGIPVDGTSAVAASIYRLEGWNLPTVTWSKGFAGDFPNCGFAAVRWSGGTWTNGADESVVSKIGAFNLLTWLPDDLEDDYVFCFTPDGGLVTNDLPALDNRYVVVVGQYLDVSAGGTGSTLNGGKDPISLFISPYGAIEVVTGTPGGAIASAGDAGNATSEPVGRTEFEPGEVRLSNIVVTPRMDGQPDDEGFCVPGQYVTLEVYAYDPEGRGLFAKWKQPTAKGIFTYPDGGAGTGAVLESEVDRMEFLQAPPPGVTWSGTAPPAGGVFRARWGWTVPENSTPGTTYEIEVDVKDAKGECEIINPPPKITMTTAPSGRIIAERFINPPGIWQIVQLNPDGSGQRLLSPVGVPESMPSIDRTGTKMALLQGTGANRYVKVRSLEGGYERNIAGPGNFTSVALSPDGAWISYRDNAAGQLTTRQVDGSNSFTVSQSWPVSGGHTIKKSRSGFSQDSRFLIYENANTLRTVNLAAGVSSDTVFAGPVTQNGSAGVVAEQLFAPSSFVKPNGEEWVIFSLGNHDPVLVTVPWQNGAPHGAIAAFGPPMLLPDLDGPGVAGSGSGDLEDDYPAVTSDGRSLILTRSVMSDGDVEDTDGQIALVVPYNAATTNYVGPPIPVMVADIRRAVWVPAEPTP